VTHKTVTDIGGVGAGGHEKAKKQACRTKRKKEHKTFF
jgi:hypothetical protein